MSRYKIMKLRLVARLEKHKVRYTAVTLITIGLALRMRNIRVLNEFFEEEGIDPMKFWNPEWYDELHSS